MSRTDQELHRAQRAFAEALAALRQLSEVERLMLTAAASSWAKAAAKAASHPA